MCATKPVAALFVGCLISLSVAALAQSGGAPAPSDKAAGVEPLVLDDPIGQNLDWVEKSEVAALREGVIEHMELKVGMEVKKGGTIGTLHHEMAELTVKKNKLQADSIAPTAKAKAQKEVAISKVARNKRLNERTPGLVSAEDMAKDEGELKVAEAQLLEATENRGIAKAELDLAERTLKEHTIVAPIDGIVIKRFKAPGESVRANDTVVVLGNLARLFVDAYVPLEYTYRIKVGQVVEIQPSITKGSQLPIERKRFRGKITFVHPEVQTVGERGVRIRAEFDNPDFELRPGLHVVMTVFVAAEASANAPVVKDGTRTARVR
jgi:RND family efflux transporter MFP subunit